MRIIGFVPCKQTSERLFEKNLQLIDGMTLAQMAVNYLLSAPQISRVVVSTNPKMAWRLQYLVTDARVSVIEQGLHDNPGTYLCDLYADFAQKRYLRDCSDFDYLVSATPDNPQRPAEALSDLIASVTLAKCHELMVIDSTTGVKRGSVNILSYEAVQRGMVAGYTITVAAPVVDIHTAADLERAANALKQ